MTRTPSDAARDGCGAEGEPAPESEAVEAAALAEMIEWADGRARKCADNPAWGSNVARYTLLGRMLRALSSRLETAREEMKEECAKVADKSQRLDKVEMEAEWKSLEERRRNTSDYVDSANHDIAHGRMQTAQFIANRIRSLSVK
jgi:hypothetical protein